MNAIGSPVCPIFHTVYAHNFILCAHAKGQNRLVHSQKVTLSRRDRAKV
jgi:hypothetical protein